MKSAAQAILLIYCYVYSINAAKQEFELSFENFTCSSEDPDHYVKSLSCGLSKNAKRRSFNLELQFAVDIKKFYLNLRIVLPRQPHDFLLVNMTKIDGCQVLSNKNQITILQLGRASIQRYSNIPMKCPYLKDKVYYIRGFRFDIKMLPAFKFESDMLVFFEIEVENKRLLKGYIHSHIGLRSTLKRG